MNHSGQIVRRHLVRRHLSGYVESQNVLVVGPGALGEVHDRGGALEEGLEVGVGEIDAVHLDLGRHGVERPLVEGDHATHRRVGHRQRADRLAQRRRRAGDDDHLGAEVRFRCHRPTMPL